MGKSPALGASADQLALPLTNSDLSYLLRHLTSLCTYSPSAWQVRISIHPLPAGCPLRTLSRESLLLSACSGRRPRQAESEAGVLVLAALSLSGQSLGSCRGLLRPQLPRGMTLQQQLPGAGVPPLTLPPGSGAGWMPPWPVLGRQVPPRLSPGRWTVPSVLGRGSG